MSRIQVTVATATATDIVLTDEKGEVAFVATSYEVVPIGNSIGGYLVAPMLQPHRWGFWRVTGGERERLTASGKLPEGVSVNGGEYVHPVDERLMAQVLEREPEGVVVRGRKYLFATTSGSARNGVVHRVRPVTDPIRRALGEVGLDLNTGRIIALGEEMEILNQGEVLSTRCHLWHQLASDGELVLGGAVPLHFLFDRALGSLEQLDSYEGASYVLALQEGWGSSATRSMTVAVSPGADRAIVAQAILDLVATKSQLKCQAHWRKFTPSS